MDFCRAITPRSIPSLWRVSDAFHEAVLFPFYNMSIMATEWNAHMGRYFALFGAMLALSYALFWKGVHRYDGAAE